MPPAETSSHVDLSSPARSHQRCSRDEARQRKESGKETNNTALRMKLSVLLVLATFAALAEGEESFRSIPTCGQSPKLQQIATDRGRIIGGTRVEECSTIPWQVHLLCSMYLCGGSILSERHILTAAHCLHKISTKYVRAFVAELDRFDKKEPLKEKFELRNVTMHPDFKRKTYESDIAVLTLSKPMKFDNACKRPICLDPHYEFDGQTCIVSGWGKEEIGGYTSQYLNMVKVLAHRGDRCNDVFGIPDKTFLKDERLMLCAGNKMGGKDTCKGDSGGPLVCWNNKSERFVQVGICSHGRGCGRAEYPGMYTNVGPFYDWIQQVMRENSY